MQGVDALTVTIEVSSARGFDFTLVGLPDTAVKESYERIRTALKENGFQFPHKEVIANLAPADIRKEGAVYDLPLALCVLAVGESMPADELDKYMIMGELSLDGSVKPVKGVLPMAIKAREQKFKGIIVPYENVREAAVVNNLEVYGVKHLTEAVHHLDGTEPLSPVVIDTRAEFAHTVSIHDLDFSDVKGQESAKRALEVACAGGHNVLMVGSPGSGKSMLAKRLPSILPSLSLHEALETTKVHSVAGKLKNGSTLMAERPFRSPHHTISPVALVGGGSNPMPGEISLAHNGILYLDELPEFGRQVLEVMRQPLEDHSISISRAKYAVEYPASFMLVASMNPCPCGYYTHPTRQCTCAPGAVQRYLNRISGPLLDRIDIQIEVAPVEFDDMTSTVDAEPSKDIRARVEAAREIQRVRFANYPEVHCNAQMNSKLIKRYATPDEAGLKRLREAIEKMGMSARAYDRILKVARTIADLSNIDMSVSEAVNAPILSEHIAEAISYRNLDRSSWGTTTLA